MVKAEKCGHGVLVFVAGGLISLTACSAPATPSAIATVTPAASPGSCPTTLPVIQQGGRVSGPLAPVDAVAATLCLYDTSHSPGALRSEPRQLEGPKVMALGKALNERAHPAVLTSCGTSSTAEAILFVRPDGTVDRVVIGAPPCSLTVSDTSLRPYQLTASALDVVHSAFSFASASPQALS